MLQIVAKIILWSLVTFFGLVLWECIAMQYEKSVNSRRQSKKDPKPTKTGKSTKLSSRLTRRSTRNCSATDDDNVNDDVNNTDDDDDNNVEQTDVSDLYVVKFKPSYLLGMVRDKCIEFWEWTGFIVGRFHTWVVIQLTKLLNTLLDILQDFGTAIRNVFNPLFQIVLSPLYAVREYFSQLYARFGETQRYYFFWVVTCVCLVAFVCGLMNWFGYLDPTVDYFRHFFPKLNKKVTSR